MNLPFEIFEQILLDCSLLTLRICKRVSQAWYSAVHSLPKSRMLLKLKASRLYFYSTRISSISLQTFQEAWQQVHQCWPSNVPITDLLDFSQKEGSQQALLKVLSLNVINARRGQLLVCDQQLIAVHDQNDFVWCLRSKTNEHSVTQIDSQLAAIEEFPLSYFSCFSEIQSTPRVWLSLSRYIQEFQGSPNGSIHRIGKYYVNHSIFIAYGNVYNFNLISLTETAHHCEPISYMRDDWYTQIRLDSIFNNDYRFAAHNSINLMLTEKILNDAQKELD